MFMEMREENEIKRTWNMTCGHRKPAAHLLPHERRTLMHIEFDETDWKLLREVFGDEDTAVAAAEIIMEAPPEIQILAIQVMDIIKEVA